jgi:hypothetical protein
MFAITAVTDHDVVVPSAYIVHGGRRQDAWAISVVYDHAERDHLGWPVSRTSPYGATVELRTHWLITPRVEDAAATPVKSFRVVLVDNYANTYKLRVNFKRRG